jgi:type IV secretory pathway VirB4 component
MIEHRKYAKGLGDLLLIDAMIEDGIVLQLDGSLLAAWQYTGPDMESADPTELNALVWRLNDALKLGSDWMFHCDVIRSEAPGYPDGGSFPDPVSQVIDEERRQQFTADSAQYQSEYFIALTYLPPTARQQKAVNYWVVDGSSGDSISRQHIARFASKIEQFENVFATQLKAYRLKRKGEMDELLRYIHRCVTGHNHPIRLPSIPIGLNDVLSSEDFSGGTRPRIGPKHIAVVAIDGFPKVSKPGILGALDQLPIAYRWSTRAILMDPEQAKALLGKARKKWKSTERGFAAQVMKTQSAPVNLDSLEMQADAAEATKSASQNTVHFCMYTSVVVILDEDPQRLKESARQVQRTLQNLGFPARLETVNAIEAWRGSIPGDGYCNVRRVQLHTLNLADMLPITSVWTGLGLLSVR